MGQLNQKLFKAKIILWLVTEKEMRDIRYETDLLFLIEDEEDSYGKECGQPLGAKNGPG